MEGSILLLRAHFRSVSVPRSKKKNNKKPWITPELKRSIRQKNKLYLVFHKRPTLFNEIRYKSLKRTVRCAIRRAEKEYYHVQLEANRNNIKKTWEILNGLMGRDKKKNPSKRADCGK